MNKKLKFETRQKIAYLAALTLMFSYAELLIPRIFPYFRLGLGNAALLMGLELSFSAFMLLGVVKTVCAYSYLFLSFPPQEYLLDLFFVTPAFAMLALTLTPLAY